MERPDLNVVFIVYGQLDRRSGGFLYDDHLRRRLEYRGHHVAVVSQKQGRLFGLLRQNGRRFRDRITEESPDLILADELNHPSLFMAFRRLNRSGFVTAAVVHHLRYLENLPFLEKKLVSLMERFFLKSVHGYIANSRNTQVSVRHLIDTTAIPSQVVTPGADNTFGKPREPKEGLRILFVGNLIPRKGLDRLIRALEIMNEERWELDIVGDDRVDIRYAEHCKTTFSHLVENGRVKFHGRIDDEELDYIRSRCDVLAVPSDMEGFGIVYLEAMRAGLIPIGSQNGGAEELIRHGVDGFLISPEKTDYLAEILHRLATDTKLRVRLSKAALERSREFPDWEKTMHTAVDFLEGLISWG